jgi:hypothetical protein
MTAKEAAYTGEHRRPLAPLPDVDWRADLFASAIVDDYELDDELARDDRSRVPVHELPDSDGDRGPVIWLYQPAHPGTLTGVAP